MPRQNMIKVRRDTSTNWNSVNPVLADGEIAYDKTCESIIIGDGIKTFLENMKGSASSTIRVQSIYVDKAATGNGTGVDWTNAFTTIQAAVDSLPAIINHAVTIYVRNGATPYRETVIIRRVVSGGSLTLRGEYSHTYQAASNSTASKLVKNASDDFADVEVGDLVYLLQYSGTYEASIPTSEYIGTVSNVDNKASGYVTISNAVTPTTGWRYVIVKPNLISGADTGTTPARGGIVCYCNVTITGMSVVDSTASISSRENSAVTISNCIITTSSEWLTAGISSAFEATVTVSRSYVSCGRGCISADGGSQISIKHSALIGTNVSTNMIIYAAASSLVNVWDAFTIIKSITGAASSGYGIYCESNSVVKLHQDLISGESSGSKLGTAIYGTSGGVVIVGTVTFSNVTTQKTPANWAATTDGSYIQ